MINKTPAEIIAAIKAEFPKLRKFTVVDGLVDYRISCGDFSKKYQLTVFTMSRRNGFSFGPIESMLPKELSTGKFEKVFAANINNMEDSDFELFMKQLRMSVAVTTKYANRF